MKPLVIFGSGGFAREVHQVIVDCNRVEPQFEMLGYLDSDESRHGVDIHGFPVLGGHSWLAARPEVAVAIGIGAPQVRRRLAVAIREQGPHEFPVLVHPRAWVGDRVRIGEGTVICAGNNVTCDIEIGDHVILNLDCTVGHDTKIGAYTNVNPSVNVSGMIEIGEGCNVGTGATIIQGIQIGEWAVIGAGATVVRDVPPNVTAVGMPAKVIKEREAGWHL